MFNILIVEDDTPTSEGIKEVLSIDLPEATVQTAATVDEGHRLILEAHRTQRPLHAVILDMKVPKSHIKQQPLVHDTLCRAMRRHMPDALVAHITAYYEENEVTSHLNEFHSRRFGNRAIWLWKMKPTYEDGVQKPTYVDELIDELKPFLYGLRIQEEIRRVFDFGPASGGPTDRRKRHMGPRNRGRSLTHDLGGLMREIAARWPHLDEDMREEVKELFTVKEEKKKENDEEKIDVVVSLFKAKPAAAEAEEVAEETEELEETEEDE